MKTTFLSLVLFTLNANAMQHEACTRALCTAIQKNDVLECEYLVNDIIKPETHGLESMRLLLKRYHLDTQEIERELAQIKKIKQERARSWCNSDFYKNLGISATCFTSAAFLTGLFIAIPVINREFDFLKNGLTIGSSVSILTALGVKHLKSAYTNEDAVNEYARQLAIKYFVKKIPSATQKEQV